MINRQELKRRRKPDPSAQSWADRARQTIAQIHAGLPNDVTLEERMAAVDAAYPFLRRAHYPYQVWCLIRRQYLIPYGYVPQNAPEGPPLVRRKGEMK
jgi:hypothetical protein